MAKPRNLPSRYRCRICWRPVHLWGSKAGDYWKHHGTPRRDIRKHKAEGVKRGGEVEEAWLKHYAEMDERAVQRAKEDRKEELS